MVLPGTSSSATVARRENSEWHWAQRSLSRLKGLHHLSKARDALARQLFLLPSHDDSKAQASNIDHAEGHDACVEWIEATAPPEFSVAYWRRCYSMIRSQPENIAIRESDRHLHSL